MYNTPQPEQSTMVSTTVNKAGTDVERPTLAARLREKVTINHLSIRGLHRAVQALAEKHGVPAPSFPAIHSYTYERTHGPTEPSALTAALMAEALKVPLTWLVFGEGSDAPPPTHGQILASVAPDAVPVALRQRFGALTSAYVLDLGLHGAAETRPAVMRILTAMMAQVQRERGERAGSPAELLAQLQGWRGDDALLDYLWHSVKAAAILEHVQRQRAPKPAPAPQKRAKARKPPTAARGR
jgi:transcriptional regulator with XRE-family HTH domain